LAQPPLRSLNLAPGGCAFHFDEPLDRLRAALGASDSAQEKLRGGGAGGRLTPLGLTAQGIRVDLWRKGREICDEEGNGA
jgi:hypothetical protein